MIGGCAFAFEDRAALLRTLWHAGKISTLKHLVQLKQSLDTALSGLQLESLAWQAWFNYLTVAGGLNHRPNERTHCRSWAPD